MNLIFALLLIGSFSAQAAITRYFPESQTTGEVAILVHGMNPTPHQFDEMAKALEEKNYQVYEFDYDDKIGTLTEHAQDFKNDLVKSPFLKMKTFSILAHSMGGLVTKAMLNLTPDADTFWDDINEVQFVAMSTPWGGDYFANIVKYVPWKESVEKKIPMVYEIASYSSFMQKMHGPLPRKIRFTFLESTEDSVAKPRTKQGKLNYQQVKDLAGQVYTSETFDHIGFLKFPGTVLEVLSGNRN